MDISLTIVRAIVYLVILCVQGFRLRRKNKNLKNRLPAKKAQNACRAVVREVVVLAMVVVRAVAVALARGGGGGGGRGGGGGGGKGGESGVLVVVR